MRKILYRAPQSLDDFMRNRTPKKIVKFLIDADQDWITCTCGVVVSQGKVCNRPGCRQRIQGPSVENQTRKILTKGK